MTEASGTVFLGVVVFQHGAGGGFGLQHLPAEPERPHAVGRPPEPPAERRAAAEHRPAGGRGRCLREPRAASH